MFVHFRGTAADAPVHEDVVALFRYPTLLLLFHDYDFVYLPAFKVFSRSVVVCKMKDKRKQRVARYVEMEPSKSFRPSCNWIILITSAFPC